MTKTADEKDRDLAEFLSKKSDEMMSYVTRDFMRELSKDELSMNQYSVLKQLDARSEMHMGHLAESLGVTAPAITTMVDKLERDQYVRRIRSSRDRRVVNVGLTPRARDAIDRLRNANLKLLDYLLARMTGSEKKCWASIYEKITDLLRERARELKKTQ